MNLLSRVGERRLGHYDVGEHKSFLEFQVEYIYAMLSRNPDILVEEEENPEEEEQEGLRM